MYYHRWTSFVMLINLWMFLSMKIKAYEYMYAESYVFRLMTLLSKSISSTKFLSKHFVDKLSSTSISSTEHFVDRIFRRQIFVDKHFVDRTLRRQDILSTEHFIAEYFSSVKVVNSSTRFPPSPSFCII